jgi:hypothetical protein
MKRMHIKKEEVIMRDMLTGSFNLSFDTTNSLFVDEKRLFV